MGSVFFGVLLRVVVFVFVCLRAFGVFSGAGIVYGLLSVALDGES